MITSAQQEFYDYAEPPADDYCPVAAADKIMSDFMEFGAAEHGGQSIGIETLVIEDVDAYEALMGVICTPTAENANKLSSAVLQQVEKWADEQTSHRKWE